MNRIERGGTSLKRKHVVADRVFFPRCKIYRLRKSFSFAQVARIFMHTYVQWQSTLAAQDNSCGIGRADTKDI